MITDRHIVEVEINKLIRPLIRKSALVDVAKGIEKKHNIPSAMILDFFTARKSFSEASEFELFCMCEALMDKDRVSKYFTQSELLHYKDEIVENPSIDFPICIKCVQVSGDQYIGATDVRKLYELRNGQLIRYNKQTQRIQKRIINKGEVYYKIMLNNNEVNEIEESFERRNFIPNTITLNIPPDSDSIYYYDQKKNELVIEKLEYFDITDGYHRFVAMCRVMDKDPTFNYPMELRITTFDIPRAQTFVSQEALGTKMRKTESASLNMNSTTNIITERVNKDSSFVLYDQIQRNGGLVDFVEFADILNYLISNDKDSASIPVSQRITKEKAFIVQKFNELASDSDFDFSSHTFNFKELCIILYGMYQYKDSKVIFEALKKQDQLTPKKFSIKHARKVLFTEIDKLW